MFARSVYAESEHFKRGWVAGFYDARSDDGVRYLDDILRYGILFDDQHEFMAGYRYGRTARVGLLSPNSHASASYFYAAA